MISKTHRRLILCMAITLLSATAALGQRSAARAEEEKTPQAYLREDSGNYFVEVYTYKAFKAPREGATVAKDVVASLFADKVKVPVTLAESTDALPNEGRFKILISQTHSQVAQNVNKYVVGVHRYPDDAGDEGWVIPVTWDLSVDTLKGNPRCETSEGYVPYSIIVQNESKLREGTRRLEDVVRFLEGANPSSVLTVAVDPRKVITSKPELRTVTKVQVLKQRAGAGGVQELRAITVCMMLDRGLPHQDFDIRFSFNPTSPLELSSASFLLTDQAGMLRESSIAKLDDSKVGQRQLEKNLDMAGLLASSVTDEEQPDKTLVRKRKTQGTLDLRFAPWLNFHPNKNIPQTVRTPKYFTPFFIDAKISTGKIIKDTLSLNRVIVGSEAEIRNFRNSKRYPTFYRYIFRGTSASDRDFKLAEFKVGFELQPHFGSLNQPLNAEFDVGPNTVDPNPKRGPKIIERVNGFGWQIQPILGLEFGRRYRNHLPAEAVAEAFKDVSPLVRRFYFGTNMEYNLTRRATITIKDIFFVRGEVKERRLRNYFIASLEAPLGNFGNNTAYGVFFSFERGGQPPFATPDVNVVKVGYRIKSNGWFDRIR